MDGRIDGGRVLLFTSFSFLSLWLELALSYLASERRGRGSVGIRFGARIAIASVPLH